MSQVRGWKALPATELARLDEPSSFYKYFYKNRKDKERIVGLGNDDNCGGLSVAEWCQGDNRPRILRGGDDFL